MMAASGKKGGLSGREWLAGLIAGLLVLAGLGYALTNMGTRARGDWMTGVIEKKEFVPREPATEITVGSAGVSSRAVEGEYLFIVRGEGEGKEYTVWVGKAEFEEKRVGDRFRFLRPRKGVE